MTLGIGDFFHLNGNFNIEKSSTTVSVVHNETTTSVEADLLTIGASGLDAFAGIDGGTTDALGFSLTGLEFGLAILGEKGGAARSWYGLKANASSAAFVGIEDVELSVSNVALLLHQANSDGSLVDYSASPLNVVTGPDAVNDVVTLDMDGASGELLQLSGTFAIQLFDFFRIDGSMALEKSSGSIVLSDGSTVATDRLTIGGANLNAFIGAHGGSDPNNRGDNAIGFNAVGTSFALALHQAGNGQTYTSLRAQTGAVGFIGIDNVTLDATGLEVRINTVDTGEVVVDYADGTSRRLQ